MLSVQEIKYFIDEDAASEKKIKAKQGQAYYEGEHDIKQYRLFYWDSDGNLQEDKYRSNIRISHPFFTELVDQAVQYILSGQDGFAKSDIPELQGELDNYFNYNDGFIAELSEVLTNFMTKGFAYMHSYKNDEERTAFESSEPIGVIEIRAKDADDKTEHVIYWYVDRIEKGQKKIKRIQVWDAQKVYYYVQTDEGKIEKDTSEKINPKPHVLYKEGEGKAEQITYDEFGYIPFFRLDNNKKQTSDLLTVKDLIDDYDMHACALSNNLVDFDSPLHVVKGYEGHTEEDMRKLQHNLKTKRIVGVDADGSIEVHTVDIPFEARKSKLELDEKNIYRFGMGLNTEGLKDTSATTNIQIKAMYSLLDLKCYKKIIMLKPFLRKLVKVVIDEINDLNGTDYQQKDVYFVFEPEIMSNAKENAEIEKLEAETQGILINNLLNVAAQIGDEQLLKALCEILELDFGELKDRLDKINEEQNTTANAKAKLAAVDPDDGGNTAPVIVPEA